MRKLGSERWRVFREDGVRHPKPFYSARKPQKWGRNYTDGRCSCSTGKWLLPQNEPVPVPGLVTLSGEKVGRPAGGEIGPIRGATERHASEKQGEGITVIQLKKT
jgi:hypothetical protein